MRRILRAGAIGASATAVAAGVATATAAARRHRARRRWQLVDAEERLGGLRSEGRAVTTDDGVPLHVEVDEPDTATDAPTLVFVHGWLMSLDCWHLQRVALRGSQRMVFYDQRSHGRSGAGEPKGSTVEQLARDLHRVIEATVPTGPIVLVGHSMGGMTVMEYVAEHRMQLGDRLAAVVLMGTSAGNLGRVLPGRPGHLLKGATPPMLAIAARAPRAVEIGRRLTSGPTFWLTGRLAFGADAPPEYVAFVDAMIASTAASVVWDFWPLFAELDQYDNLAALQDVSTTVMIGTRDAITPPRHGRRIADLVPGSRLVVYDDVGHMIMLERHEDVTATLRKLVGGP